MSYSFASAGANYAFPLTVGGTGTLAKVFPAPSTNSGIAATSPASLRVLLQQQGQLVSLVISGNVFVHGTAPTVNFVLQSGTSLTAASNTTILTLASAQSLTTNAWYPFCVKADLQGDNASGILQPVSSSIVCNSVSGSVTATALTGVTFGSPASPIDNIPLAESVINLVFGVTFGVSDALNAANVYQMVAGEV
jgi:hypothetical protein